MLDVNKYLQAQLALAKQKTDTKNLKNKVSERSANAAEAITKKQLNLKTKKTEDIFKPNTPNASNTAPCSDNDSDYAPSSDDDDVGNTINIPTIMKVNKKQLINKIMDDGDKKFYKERIAKWKNDLNLVLNGTFDGPITSADIKYSSCSENPNYYHELKNGLKIPYYIWKQLYKYQKIGVKWLWELHQMQAGGLLGDEMGLGKTVQIIAFLAGLSNSEIGSWGGLGPCIIVAPATVIYQWVSHFHYWCPQMRVAVLHHSGSHSGNNDRLIRDINHDHGILLVTYAGIVKYNKALTGWRWHYCILDEGHKIRNPDTQVSKILRKFPTPYKILITGSPMQNNLMELWSLYDFIRPGLLGTQNAFMEYFAIPITQGGYANASEFQEATALEIAKALKELITPYMLRRTKAEVQEYINLPEKSEQALFCSLSKEQRDLYMGYLTSGTIRSILDRDNKFGDPLRARILVAISTLRKICNHPDLYLYEAQEATEMIDEHQFGHWKRSGKMSVVHALLKLWQKQGHRALIFTQSRAMICILEQYLQTHKYKYLKMDGSVRVGQRQSLIKSFNEDEKYLVFLATTRVGGLGVNLTGADRVIIFDPDWNPATDSQAKERAWRIGQQRNVTVYRLLSAGTIEEKIYQRQVFKHLLSNKVFLDPNQKNFITTSSLQGLFSFEEANAEGDTETSSLFKNSKINLKQCTKLKRNTNVDVSILSSEEKLVEMRRKAKEISKKIMENNSAQSEPFPDENPREAYKKKREMLINPPKVIEPIVNTLDDQVTNIAFENVLSELDIVNMHTKPNYEEKIISEVLNQQDTEDGEIVNYECIVNEEKQNFKREESISIKKNYDKNSSKIKPKKRKSDCLEIQNVVSTQKVKKAKQKEVDNDDYVLSKLFAKSSVQNALHHDEIVGLAEKEKRHRLKEEASRKARDAIRAIKCSTK